MYSYQKSVFQCETVSKWTKENITWINKNKKKVPQKKGLPSEEIVLLIFTFWVSTKLNSWGTEWFHVPDSLFIITFSVTFFNAHKIRLCRLFIIIINFDSRGKVYFLF